MKKYINSSSLLKLAIIWLIVIGFMLFGKQIESLYDQSAIAIGIFLLVLLTIVVASFAVVKEADVLAHKLGEPYGTLILTLSIVSIEVILIAAMMYGPTEQPSIGKDSIFSVMMIIMNLVMGICVLFGALKYGEQSYNAQGTMSYHGMIILLSGIAMMVPNFILGQGQFNFTQAISIAVMVTIVYAAFLWLQTGRYKHQFMQPAAGKMSISFEDLKIQNNQHTNHQESMPRQELLIRIILLLLWILPIVLLSHNLAHLVDFGISAMHLPKQLGGVLIAIIVFTPESITAIKAALNNEFQRAINLCHGAFVSTVGLTVPAVLAIGLLSNKTVLFGLSNQEMILFTLTLFLSLMAFNGKKTTPIFGILQLMLFAVFVLLIFNP